MCFFKRLESSCKNNNMSVTMVSKILKISSSNVTNWKKGVIPNGDVLIRLSELLDVSIDYLLTGKDTQQQINIYPQMIQNIIDNLLNMNEEDRAIIYGETIGILRSTKYSKNTSEATRSENLSVG